MFVKSSCYLNWFFWNSYLTMFSPHCSSISVRIKCKLLSLLFKIFYYLVPFYLPRVNYSFFYLTSLCSISRASQTVWDTVDTVFITTLGFLADLPHPLNWSFSNTNTICHRFYGYCILNLIYFFKCFNSKCQS